MGDMGLQGGLQRGASWGTHGCRPVCTRCACGCRLLDVYGGAVHEISRAVGDATVHSSALLHGVTRMRRGTRYSMIMFFCATP